MDIKTLQYLKQLQRGIFEDTSIPQDDSFEVLEEVADKLYKDKIISLNNYKDEQNVTKK